MGPMIKPQESEIRRGSDRDLERYNGNGKDMKREKGKLADRRYENLH
jgi:hypothetical protein